MPALMKKKDQVEVIAFCNRDRRKAEQIAKAFHIKEAQVYSDYHALLANKDIDVVHICTPNLYHSPITVAALQAGKHVMCEKPMAINALEAAEMVQAAKESGKKLTIAFQNRFREDALLLKQSCETGELGDIYAAKAHAVRRRGVPTWGVFMDKELQGGGPLIDIGTHALDLTLWCMNNYEVHSVTASTFHELKQQNLTNPFGPWEPETFHVEDSAFAFIRMKNGAIIYLETAWALNTLDEREAMTTLFGTKGGAEMQRTSCGTHNELILNGEKHKHLYETRFQHAADIDFNQAETNTVADRELSQWIDAIIEDTSPLVTPHQSLVVAQLVDAIYKSAETGETIYL